MFVEQVRFKTIENEVFGGILIDKKTIICGCCGGVMDVEEDEIEILDHYSWIDISDAIIGE